MCYSFVTGLWLTMQNRIHFDEFNKTVRVALVLQINRTHMINSNCKITVSSHPYNHLIVEDLFDEGVAFRLSAIFSELIVAGRKTGKVGKAGELVCDATNFTPKLEHVSSSPIAHISYLELKRFVTEIFRYSIR